MKKLLKLVTLAAVALICATGCYDDYRTDYDYSVAYFSSQKHLRTVIADRDMSLSIGVAIGGKLTIDTDDWVEFEIDETLLEDQTFDFELLPSKYYTLSDRNMFRVTNSTLSIADVDIYFTDDFYEDPKTVGQYYALPFKIVDSSLDQTIEDMDYCIVAFKYQSTYHGTYYIRGTVEYEMDYEGDGEVDSFIESEGGDLVNLSTVTVETVSRTQLCIPSYPINVETSTAALYAGDLYVTFEDNGELTIEGDDVDEATGSYAEMTIEGEERLVLDLNYKFTLNGVEYNVEHELVRRLDPVDDLRFEEWAAAE